MKRKTLLLGLLAIVVMFSLIILSSCDHEHVHQFGEWSVSTEATCKADGERMRQCSCGEKEIEAIAATGHNYSNGSCAKCNADEPSPAEYFIFTELEDGTYSVKAADQYTISGKIVIPDEYNGKPVTKIETSGFGQCTKITEVVIPDSIAVIDTVAFIGCSSLVKIIIPEGITEISTACFAECDKLTEIVLPNGITKICHSAFLSCHRLQTVKIGEGLKIIEDWAFKECASLENINIPDGTESIGMSCFAFTGLKEIRIPDSVKLIGNEAFFGIFVLREVYLGSGITSISSEAFRLCSNISDVYFSGSEDDWNKIYIGDGNETLISATLHLNHKEQENENDHP